MSLNGISDANRIRVGQLLTIVGQAAPAAPAPETPAPATPADPNASGTTSYNVVAGDTLSGIAARFGTTTRNLMNLNGITNSNLIRIGQVLKLS
jgi:LysM repeat protein